VDIMNATAACSAYSMLDLPLLPRSVNLITLMASSSRLTRCVLFRRFQEQFLCYLPCQVVTSTVHAVICVTYYDEFQNTGFQWHIKFSICTCRLVLRNLRCSCNSVDTIAFLINHKVQGTWFRCSTLASVTFS